MPSGLLNQIISLLPVAIFIGFYLLRARQAQEKKAQPPQPGMPDAGQPLPRLLRRVMPHRAQRQEHTRSDNAEEAGGYLGDPLVQQFEAVELEVAVQEESSVPPIDRQILLAKGTPQGSAPPYLAGLSPWQQAVVLTGILGQPLGIRRRFR